MPTLPKIFRPVTRNTLIILFGLIIRYVTFFSAKAYVVGTQMNRLNEHLKHIFKLIDKGKKMKIYAKIIPFLFFLLFSVGCTICLALMLAIPITMIVIGRYFQQTFFDLIRTIFF